MQHFLPRLRQYVFSLFWIILLVSCNSEELPEAPLEHPEVQDCAERIARGDFSFSSQEDLEKFGALGYTTVKGKISLFYGVSDLSSLKCLRNVDFLEIRSPQLQNLKGLENLTTAEDLYIVDCTGIENLEGLNSLNSLKALVVIGNSSLKSLKGLENLKTTTELKISNNAVLENLNGLENLVSTPEPEGFPRTWDFVIELNPALKSIAGMQNISGSMGYLSITGNPVLTDLGYFDKVISMKSLSINSCKSIVNVDAFPKVTDIFALLLGNNENLEGVGFPSLIKAGFIDIQSNPNFSSLSGLSSLEEIYFSLESGVGYSLNLKYLPSLSTLDGLENVRFTGNKVDIGGFNVIKDACALKKLVGVYLNQGNDRPYKNHIDITTYCNSGDALLLDFDNKCKCN